MYKFHIFVLVNTLIYYVILKTYKNSVKNNLDNSRLLYILHIPALLYGTYYILYNTDLITSSNIPNRVYPNSVSSMSS